MEKIHIVLAKLRESGDWTTLYAFRSLQDAEDFVIMNQRLDERVHSRCWQYKIETCWLDL